jgi:hypothetical protein
MLLSSIKNPGVFIGAAKIGLSDGLKPETTGFFEWLALFVKDFDVPPMTIVIWENSC